MHCALNHGKDICRAVMIPKLNLSVRF